MIKTVNRPIHKGLNTLALFLFLAASMTVAIYSLVPSSSVGVETSDKIMHFIAYGGLAGLLLLARPVLSLWRVFLMISAIGIALEIAQGLAPTGRTASIFDQIANSCGAALAIMVWIGLAPFIHKLWQGLENRFNA